jgi:hypothetical protein
MVALICNPSTGETKAEESQDSDAITKRKIINYIFHHSIHHVLFFFFGFGLKQRNSPASASQVLGLKACATTARLKFTMF